MQAKAMEWANTASNSHLRPRDIHFTVEKKFWPKVKYGLCANNAPYDKLVAAMDKPYRVLCPLGGVIRSAKARAPVPGFGFLRHGLPALGH
jgi:hypothetical protein